MRVEFGAFRQQIGGVWRSIKEYLDVESHSEEELKLTEKVASGQASSDELKQYREYLEAHAARVSVAWRLKAPALGSPSFPIDLNVSSQVEYLRYLNAVEPKVLEAMAASDLARWREEKKGQGSNRSGD